MPPRKPEPEQLSGLAQDDTHHGQARSRALQSESAAGYNDPVTMSHAACSPSDAATLTVKSPIHSLPFEVLAEIFMFTPPDWVEVHPKSSLNSEFGECESRRRMLNPFVICAVCSSWRSIALSIPKLWRQVFVNIPSGMSADRAESKAADVVQRIKRSQSGPLTLYIFCDVSVPLDGTGPETPIVSVLTDYATRWEAVYLHRTQDDRVSAPPRRSVMFHFDGWHSLRRLCSADRHCHLYKNNTIPWAQLTHLQIQPGLAFSDSEATILLKKCPKLVQLSIAVCSLASMTGLIVMRNLVSLSLNSSCLVDVLILPSLRDVYISALSYRDVTSLLNLFTRSSCSLDKLEFYTSNLNPRGLFDLLAHRSCSSLTSLKIHQFSYKSPNVLVNSEVLQRFTFDQDDSFCPHLRFLTMDHPIKCVYTLLKMVESRICSSDGQTPDKQLQYVHFLVKRPGHKLYGLDKFGKGCGMRYERQRLPSGRRGSPRHSVSFRRQDLSRTQLQINHGGFCFDRD